MSVSDILSNLSKNMDDLSNTYRDQDIAIENKKVLLNNYIEKCQQLEQLLSRSMVQSMHAQHKISKSQDFNATMHSICEPSNRDTLVAYTEAVDLIKQIRNGGL